MWWHLVWGIRVVNEDTLVITKLSKSFLLLLKVELIMGARAGWVTSMNQL